LAQVRTVVGEAMALVPSETLPRATRFVLATLLFAGAASELVVAAAMRAPTFGAEKKAN